jgi:hypothetical protein
METKDTKSSGERKPQQEQKHPDEWMRDLSPTHMAGQNIGPDSVEQEIGVATAYDVKDVHRWLLDLPDDDLKQIPILPPGTRLQQGATYLDLKDENRREFTATGEMTVEEGRYIVPKDQVPYILWNRLIGEEKPGQ